MHILDTDALMYVYNIYIYIHIYIYIYIYIIYTYIYIRYTYIYVHKWELSCTSIDVYDDHLRSLGWFHSSLLDNCWTCFFIFLSGTLVANTYLIALVGHVACEHNVQPFKKKRVMTATVLGWQLSAISTIKPTRSSSAYVHQYRGLPWYTTCHDVRCMKRWSVGIIFHIRSPDARATADSRW